MNICFVYISGRTRQDIIIKVLMYSCEVIDMFVGFYQNFDILGLLYTVAKWEPSCFCGRTEVIHKDRQRDG
jgi:hypothetical protein